MQQNATTCNNIVWYHPFYLTHVGACSCTHHCNWVARITATYYCNNMQQRYLIPSFYSTDIGACSCTHHCNWVAVVAVIELHLWLQLRTVLDTYWCMLLQLSLQLRCTYDCNLGNIELYSTHIGARCCSYPCSCCSYHCNCGALTSNLQLQQQSTRLLDTLLVTGHTLVHVVAAITATEVHL